MLILPFHLIQSALGQKAEAKPRGQSLRERSQGRAIMHGREVARLASEMGPPLGQSRKRVSNTLTKFGLSASFSTGRVAAHAVSGVPTALVLQAITSRTGNVRFTDEVPRRLPLHAGVTAGYKSHTKCQRHASATGMGSPQPRPQGCQQRQSTGARSRTAEGVRTERQNHRVPRGWRRFMGPVSPTFKATKWPDGTSSRPLVGLLSNRPQQPPPGRTAVRPR